MWLPETGTFQCPPLLNGAVHMMHANPFSAFAQAGRAYFSAVMQSWYIPLARWNYNQKSGTILGFVPSNAVDLCQAIVAHEAAHVLSSPFKQRLSVYVEQAYEALWCVMMGDDEQAWADLAIWNEMIGRTTRAMALVEEVFATYFGLRYLLCLRTIPESWFGGYFQSSYPPSETVNRLEDQFCASQSILWGGAFRKIYSEISRLAPRVGHKPFALLTKFVEESVSICEGNTEQRPNNRLYLTGNRITRSAAEYEVAFQRGLSAIAAVNRSSDYIRGMDWDDWEAIFLTEIPQFKGWQNATGSILDKVTAYLGTSATWWHMQGMADFNPGFASLMSTAYVVNDSTPRVRFAPWPSVERPAEQFMKVMEETFGIGIDEGTLRFIVTHWEEFRERNVVPIVIDMPQASAPYIHPVFVPKRVRGRKIEVAPHAVFLSNVESQMESSSHAWDLLPERQPENWWRHQAARMFMEGIRLAVVTGAQLNCPIRYIQIGGNLDTDVGFPSSENHAATRHICCDKFELLMRLYEVGRKAGYRWESPVKCSEDPRSVPSCLAFSSCRRMA